MKERFQRMNEAIQPPEGWMERILENLPRRSSGRLLRPLGAVAAVLTVILLATPVMAVYIPAVGELMYRVAPEVAARFVPVRGSCEANGIRMEVVTSSVHASTLEVYLCFEDREGDRLREQTLPFGVTLLQPEDGIRGARQYEAAPGVVLATGGTVDSFYDPETGAVTMLYSERYHYVEEGTDRFLSIRELFGEDLTVRVDWLETDTVLFDGEISPDLGYPGDMEVHAEEGPEGWETDRPELSAFFLSCFHSSQGSDPWGSQKEYVFIQPGEPVRELGEDVAITGIALRDGWLHIQVRTRNSDGDSWQLAQFKVLDGAGEAYHPSRTAYFTLTEGEYWGDYEEYAIQLPEGGMDGCSLWCVASQRDRIRGPWEVTFPLVESDYRSKKDEAPLPTVGWGK